MRTAELRVAGVRCLVCGTGYTGEDGCELLVPPGGRRRRLGRAARRRRRPLPASAPATRCASRPASTSTATTSARTATRSRPGSAGAASRDRLHRRRRPRRPRARAAAGPLRDRPSAASPRQGTRSAPRHGAGRGDQRRPLALAGIGIGMGYVPGEDGRARAPRSRSTSAARVRAAEVRTSPSTGRSTRWPDACYPADSQVPPGPRLGADRRRHGPFGITWYAQDAVGEVVFFDPPSVGAAGRRGPALRRDRVGQGGLRRDRPDVRRGDRGQ